MKEIPLTKGKIAIVDDDMFDFLSKWMWQAHVRSTICYARRMVWDGTIGRNRGIMMHHLVLGVTPPITVDHEDRNGLNNQRYNLRVATVQQNAANRGISTKNRTGLKGVGFHGGKYEVLMTVNGKTIRVGRFSDPVEAALAYDKRATELHGDFAATNQKLGLIEKFKCRQ